MMLDMLKILAHPIATFKNLNLTNSSIINVGGDLNVYPDSKELIQALEKRDFHYLKIEIANVISLILDSKYNEAEKIIDTIFVIGLDGIETKEKDSIYYFKLIISILKKEDINLQIYIDNIKDETLKENGILIIKVYNGNWDINICKFDLLDKVTKYTILDILFAQMKFKYITKNLQPKFDSDDFWLYYYGLSCYNTHKLNEAKLYAEKLMEISNNPKYVFLNFLARSGHIIFDRKNNFINIETVQKLYNDFKIFGEKNPKIVEGNKLPYTINLLWLLLLSNRSLFLDEYHNLVTKDIASEIPIMEVLAEFYEQENKFSDALVIFERILDGDKEEAIFYHIMLCQLWLKQYSDVIKTYNIGKPICKSLSVIGLYLAALKFEDEGLYHSKLQSILESDGNKIETLFQVTLSIANKDTYAQKIIFGYVCKQLGIILDIKTSNIYRLCFARLANYLDEKIVCEKILLCLSKLNSFELRETCILLAEIKDEKLVVKVVDILLSEYPYDIDVLELKIYLCKKKNLYTSALFYSKILFEVKKDIPVATDIIALLCIRNTISSDEILPYLQFVKKSDDPRALIQCANAYYHLGNVSNATIFLYKSIYNLYNKDDYVVYSLALNLHFNMIAVHNKECNNKNIVDVDTVVELECLDDKLTTKVCLNQDFDLQSNINTIGINHISVNSTWGMLLLNRKVGTVVEYYGKKYRIKEIISKYAYLFKFLLTKCSKPGPNGELLLHSFNIDPNKEIGGQLLKIIPMNNGQKSLFESYNFKNNNIGLPIEAINSCDYDDYMDIIATLLNAKDEHLYAGMYDDSIKTASKIILTLPSLAILGYFNMLDLLLLIRDKIMVPESLVNFIKERSLQASKLNVTSPGKLCRIENRVVLVKGNPNASDFWNKLYESINTCTVVKITDEERIMVRVKELSFEEFFNTLRINFCQLDSLILAKKELGLLLCDDLFFRQLAYLLKIRTNTTLGLKYLLNEEKAAEMISIYAQSNYSLVK
jgi:hypothetical protein